MGTTCTVVYLREETHATPDKSPSLKTSVSFLGCQGVNIVTVKVLIINHSNSNSKGNSNKNNGNSTDNSASNSSNGNTQKQ